MLSVQELFDDKRGVFGVSSTSEKFRNDFIRSLNSVLDDLNFWGSGSLSHIESMSDNIPISTAYLNTVNDGLDYYLMSRFEWTCQRKGDVKAFYDQNLRRVGTIVVGADAATGRMGKFTTTPGWYISTIVQQNENLSDDADIIPSGGDPL